MGFLDRLLGKGRSPSAQPSGCSCQSGTRSAHPTPPRSTRSSYEESCKKLQEQGHLEQGKIPPMPPRKPRYDDEEPLGVNFFRTKLEGDLSNLTLPRTFFGRSLVTQASFCNTDLSESTFCWNDFDQVDFSDSNLNGSDLRASHFVQTVFRGANLQQCDLRRSGFDGCDFTDADMRGAKLTRADAQRLALSREQLESIDWQDDDGEEPDGG